MAFTGPLEDRLEIRELIDTYADAVQIRDAEAWGSVWAEDAYWALPEFPKHEGFTGKRAIVEGWVMSMTDYASMTDFSVPMIYVANPGAIEVTGDTARGHSYTSEIYRDPRSQQVHRIRGRYDDELRRIDGRWLFTKRIYRVLHRD